jgi:cardiolipin synthase
VLTRQLAVDSAAELARHPLRSGFRLCAASAGHLAAAAHGIFGKRLAMRLVGPPRTVSACRGTLDPAALEADLHRLTGNALQPVDIQLYPEGGEALAALKDVIDQARCRIDVLMFEWENDALGATVASWLAAKASPQLHVRVLVDGGGNLIFGNPEHKAGFNVNRVVCALAEWPHVEVIRTRNPFGRFDHRKLVLADGRLAWAGGRNFTHASFFHHHDLSFTLAGPLVGQLQELFDASWREQGGHEAVSGQGSEVGSASASSPAPGPASATEAPPVSLTADPWPLTPALARLACTEPGQHHLAAVLYRAVDQAREHVWLENFSFSDNRLVCKLARARRRGVDVRVVLTVTGCTEPTNHANRVIANRLRRAGVAVYVYPGMTHTKAAAVDGCWAYLGTGNFDPLSLRRNRELGLAIAAGPLIGEIEERLFLPDFRPEWELKQPFALSASDYAWELLGGFFL